MLAHLYTDFFGKPLQTVYDILTKASLLHHHRPPISGLAQFGVGPSIHRFLGTLFDAFLSLSVLAQFGVVPSVYTDFVVVGKMLQTDYDSLMKALLLHQAWPPIPGSAQFGV